MKSKLFKNMILLLQVRKKLHFSENFYGQSFPLLQPQINPLPNFKFAPKSHRSRAAQRRIATRHSLLPSTLLSTATSYHRHAVAAPARRRIAPRRSLNSLNVNN